MSDLIEPLLQALADRPDDPDAFVAARDALATAGQWRRMVALHEQLADGLSDVVPDYWHDLLRLLEAVARDLVDAEARSEALVAIGDLWETRLRREDQAVLNFQAAFKTWPRNAEALDRARAVYVRADNYKLVRRLWELQMQVAADETEQVYILCELAEIDRKHLGDVNGARMALERALGVEPGNARARRMLDVLEGRTRDWHAELAALRSAWDTATGTRRAQAALRLAAFAAVDAPEGLADPEPWLAEAEAASPPPDGVGMVRAAVLRRNHRYDELARHLESMIASAADPEELADLEADLARVLRADLGKPGLAEAAARRALGARPAHGPAFAELRAVLVTAARWSDLANAWEAWLTAHPRDEASADDYAALAELLWRRVGDMDRAAEAFAVVREREPGHETALRFFVDRASRQGDDATQVRALRDLADAVDVEQGGELFERAAHIAEERLDEPRLAAELWEEVARRSPGHPRAGDALMRLYERSEQWNRLVEQLRRRIDAIPSGDPSRVPLLHRVAGISAGSLHQPVLAASALREVLDIHPNDAAALDGLTARYREAGRWTDLVELLKRRAAASTAPAERAELNRSIASIWIDELDNAVEAIDPLERVLEDIPGDGAALTALAHIHASRGDGNASFDAQLRRAAALDGEAQVEALASLSDQARALDDERRAAVLDLRLRVDVGLDVSDVSWLLERARAASDGGRLGELLLVAVAAGHPLDVEAAMDCARLATDPGDALSWWSRVLDETPGHAEAREQSIATLAAGGDPDALVTFAHLHDAREDVLTTLLAGADDAPAPGDWLAAAADLAGDLGDADAEHGAVVRLSERAPDDVGVLRRLAAMHQRAGRTDAWASTVEAMLPLVDAAEAADLRAALGAAYSGDLHDPHAAYRTARDAWRAANDIAHLDALVAAGEQADVRAEVLDDLRAAAARLPSGPLRTAYFKHIADTALAVGDAPTEIDFRERLVAEAPRDVASLGALAERYRTSRDAGRRAEVLSLLADAVDAPEARRAALVERGLVLAEQLARAEEAVALLREVVEEAPEDPAAAVALRRSLDALGDVPGALESTSHELATAPDDAARAIALVARVMLAARDEGGDAVVVDAAESLLALDETPPQFAEAVGAALDAAGRIDRWDAVLEGLERRERWGLLADALERRGDSDDGEEGAAALRRAAALYEEQLGEADAAYFTYARLIASHPSMPEDWDAMTRLSTSCADAEDLLARWSAAVEQRGDAAPAGLVQRLAGSSEEAGDVDAAMRAWRRAWAGGIEAAGDALERLLDAAGDRVGQIELALERADRTSGAERISRLRQGAELLAADPGRRDEAVAIYHAIVDEDPGAFDVFAALDRLLTAAGEHGQRASLLERWYDATNDPETRRDLAVQRAHVLRDSLDDASEAAELLLQLSDPAVDAELVATIGLLDPADDEALIVRVLDAVEPRVRASGAAALLGRLLEARLATSTDADARAAWHLELADVHESAGAADEAFEHRRAAVASGRYDRAIGEALEAGAAQLERWADLAAAYEVAVELVPTPAARAALHKRLGAIYARRVSASHDAVLSYEAALALDPGDAEVVAALVALRRGGGDDAGLAEALAQRAALTEGDERTQALAELATLRAAAGDGNGALEAAEQIDPVAALAVFEALVDAPDADVRTRALKGAAAAYRAEGRTDALQMTLIALVDAGDDAAIDDLVDALVDSTDEAVAFEGWSRVVAQRPADASSRKRLRALAESTFRWASYVDALRGAVERANAVESVPLWREIALAQQEYLEDMQAAADAWKRVLDAGADAEAVHALERIFQQERDYAGLVALWLEQADQVVDKDERVAVLRKAADAQLSVLGDRDGAAATCERIEETGALATSVALFCERVWRETGRTERLLESMRSRAAHADAGSAARAAHVEVAAVARALAQDPAVAFAALDDAFGDGSATDPDVDEQLRGELLAQIAAAAGDQGLLGRLHGLAARGVVAPATLRVQLLSDGAMSAEGALAAERWSAVAAVYRDELGEPAAAFDAWARALDASPGDGALRTAVMDAAELVGAWPAAAAILAAEAERLPVDQAADAWRAAAVAAERAGDTAARLRALQSVAAADGDAPDAVRAVDEALAAAGAWEELAAVLAERVERAASPEAAADAGVALSTLYLGQLEDADLAATIATHALAACPEHEGAFEALERAIGGGDSDSTRAAMLWSTAADAMGMTPAAVPLWLRAVDSAEHAGDEDDVVAWLKRATAISPADEEVSERTEQVCAQLGRWDDVAAVLRARAATVTGEARVDALVMLATVCRDHLNDPSGAIEAWEGVLTVDERHDDAWAQLAVLYEAEGRWPRAHLAHVRRAENETDPEVRVSLRMSAARLALDGMDDLALALSSCRAVLAERPAHADALQLAVGVLARMGDAAGAAGLLDAGAEATDVVADALALRVQAATYDAEHAEARLRAVLELDATHIGAQAALGRALVAAGRGGEAIALLEAAASDLEGSARAALLVALAEAHPAGSNASMDALESALEADGAHVGAHRATIAHLEASGDVDALMLALERFSSVAQPSDRPELLRRRASVAWNGLGDRGRTIVALEALVVASPDDLDAAIELAEQYRATAQLTGARQIVAPTLRRATGQRTRLARLRHVEGGIAEDEGMTEDAIVAYEAAYALDPSNVAVLLDLGRVLLTIEAYERALKPLQAAMIHHTELADDHARASLYVMVARARQGVGDADRAVLMARRALALEPENEEAASIERLGKAG